ncbi:hypothetical protein V5O48_004110 [Marasmius crinis-equi]|uniref:Transmembrane protein n=1 Tax=Marasmius crinis-equi TaxID=585013 RepID=A0ABR3FR36_9AGAR
MVVVHAELQFNLLGTTIPGGTKIPAYAFTDVSVNDTFLLGTARGAVLLPETAGTTTSTAQIDLPSSPSSSTSTGAADSNQKPSNTGMIVGGVIGGLVALCTVAILTVTYFRRRNAGVAPSALFDMDPPTRVVGADGAGRGSYTSLRLHDVHEERTPPPQPSSYTYPMGYTPAVPLYPNRPRGYER